MKISKIDVKNYRRFLATDINISENDLVVIAGANNSGKTSLVQLLNTIFNNKQNLCEKDISIQKRQELIEQLEKELNLEFLSIEAFTEKVLLFFKETEIEEYIINVNITVSYGEEETITLFSDYLMDLDEKKREFYFKFTNEFNFSMFEKMFADNIAEVYKIYIKIYSERNEIAKLTEQVDANRNKLYLKEKYNFEKILFKIIGSCLKNSYYYTNSSFTICRNMEYSAFSKLFNFDYISADRELDDETLKKKKITTSIIESTDPLSENFTWKDQFDSLYKSIDSSLKKSGVESMLQTNTFSAFSTIKSNMDLVGETQINAIESMLEFDENILLRLIKDSLGINYVYQKGESKIYLGEETQGLGISNLIFISLQIITYRNKIKTNVVNFFVIEEPEAHMHIQMQRVLISFLQDLFTKDTNIQGMISTHSSEIIKDSNLASLKIIRPTDPFENKICDLYEFMEKNKNEKTFYETFFKLNFSNLIFSDKAIMYEGDTERMFIESVITRDSTFSDLSKRYISYCQVGGAYAHKYFKLISELGIKVCVFTDMDYSKEQDSVELLMDDGTTNATLNILCKEANNDIEGKLTIGDIYKWQESNRSSDSLIETFTQKKEDGYARTLEEAILFKYILKEKNFFTSQLKSKLDLQKDLENFNVFTKLPRMFWISVKEKSRFEISIPTSKKEIDRIKKEYNEGSVEYNKALDSFKKQSDFLVKRSIREMVKSISNNKSDFMYSIIDADMQMEILPEYIMDGLTWL